MSGTLNGVQLCIGIPSKGRLQENAFAFFERAGLAIIQPHGARDYRGTIAGLPGVEIAFLSAAEIAGELARGACHFGITGADLIEENLADPRAKVAMLAPLGFGHANVVIAVPEAWIDVQDLADIEDIAADLRHKHGRRLKVATKYFNLTRRFFKAHGIADYRIVESLGATEGAPASGSADIIVDITTTGATLAANGLKVLDGGLILKSEAHLVASRLANWSSGARELARRVLASFAAEETARTCRELRAFFDVAPAGSVHAALAEAGADILSGQDATPLTLLARRQQVAGLADLLLSHGARRVIVAAPHYVFGPESPLYSQLLAAIEPLPTGASP